MALQKMSQRACSVEDNGTLYKLIIIISIALLKHYFFSGEMSTQHQATSACYFLSYAKERTP